MTQVLHHEPTTVVPTQRSRGRRLASFTRHFLEMCAGMCVAWMVLGLPLLALAAGAGQDDPVRELPELAVLLAATVMSLGMAPVMRWRGHSWRCVAEMSAAMYVEAVVLIAVAWAGLFATASLFAVFHGLMPLVMVLAMLPRLELYTSPVGSHAHRQ